MWATLLSFFCTINIEDNIVGAHYLSIYNIVHKRSKFHVTVILLDQKLNAMYCYFSLLELSSFLLKVERTTKN
jgi:hypothetical protein